MNVMTIRSGDGILISGSDVDLFLIPDALGSRVRVRVIAKFSEPQSSRTPILDDAADPGFTVQELRLKGTTFSGYRRVLDSVAFEIGFRLKVDDEVAVELDKHLPRLFVTADTIAKVTSKLPEVLRRPVTSAERRVIVDIAAQRVLDYRPIEAAISQALTHVSLDSGHLQHALQREFIRELFCVPAP